MDSSLNFLLFTVYQIQNTKTDSQQIQYLFQQIFSSQNGLYLFFFSPFLVWCDWKYDLILILMDVPTPFLFCWFWSNDLKTAIEKYPQNSHLLCRTVVCFFRYLDFRSNLLCKKLFPLTNYASVQFYGVVYKFDILIKLKTEHENSVQSLLFIFLKCYVFILG